MRNYEAWILFVNLTLKINFKSYQEVYFTFFWLLYKIIYLKFAKLFFLSKQITLRMRN